LRLEIQISAGRVGQLWPLYTGFCRPSRPVSLTHHGVQTGSHEKHGRTQLVSTSSLHTLSFCKPPKSSVLDKIVANVSALQSLPGFKHFWKDIKKSGSIADMRKELDNALRFFRVRRNLDFEEIFYSHIFVMPSSTPW
jgi:hypothetical protein